jgi:tRNA threonylcarbamoyladenosine biosynthesis protein TsaB
MSTILCIDTALPLASVSVSQNGNLLSERISDAQKDHAAFLHPAIHSILKELQIELQEINAVAVTIGPGSYTGLRVGLASAKGLCYALKKPLISLCTLETMAKQTQIVLAPTDEMLFCPMIDARRMEVFTAVYESDLTCMINPHAKVLDKESFQEILLKKKVCFSGNGSAKFMNLINHENAIHAYISTLSDAMAKMSDQYFNAAQFSQAALIEPNYLKAYQI